MELLPQQTKVVLVALIPEAVAVQAAFQLTAAVTAALASSLSSTR
jgi:hypothetical protein